MNRKLFILLLILSAFIFGQTQTAHADYLIRFSDGGGFKSAFTGSVGGTITVEAWVSQDTPDTLLTDEGLFQFHTLAAMDTTLLGSFSSTDINTEFANQFDNSNTTMIDWLADDGINAVFGNDVLLGSFDFTITAAGTTTITFGDNSTALDEWITPAFTVLDDLIFGAAETDTFSLTISATGIPEPTTFGLLLLGFVAFSLRRKTRTVVAA